MSRKSGHRSRSYSGRHSELRKIDRRRDPNDYSSGEGELIEGMPLVLGENSIDPETSPVLDSTHYQDLLTNDGVFPLGDNPLIEMETIGDATPAVEITQPTTERRGVE